jgi:isopenicillin-N N-acyltransferase like protein
MPQASSHRKTIQRVDIVIGESPLEAGRAYGETYSEDIARQVDAYQPYFQLLGLDPEEVGRRAEQNLLPATAQAFPDYVSELRGRAEGAGVPLRRLFPLNCMEEIWSWVVPEKMRELEALASGAAPGGHCTTLGLRHGGRTVMGHNEDWLAVDLDTTMLLHDVRVPDGSRFLSLQFVGMVPWSGINSHGIAITANTLPATDAVPGVPNAFVLRWVLESRSLEQVWDRVRMSQRGLGTYVLAGDACGRLCAMETSAGQASCLPVDEWTAETNHFTHDSLQQLRSLPVSEDSLGRLARAEALIGAGKQSADDPLALTRLVLTDHDAACSRAICGHPRSDVPKLLQTATVACTVYEPTDSRLGACVGPWCQQELEVSSLD